MTSNLQARRATVDDLMDLRRLWHQAGLPVGELEKQLTDFQVVESADGRVLATLALRIDEQQGYLHSVTCCESENTNELCERLWSRVRALARNHGLYRIWTQENAAFWKSLGFEPPLPEVHKKLPSSFGPETAPWTALKLRDEAASNISLEHEFDAFTRAQRESSERVIRQAQVLKNLAYVILFVALVAGAAVIAFAVLPSSFWSRLVNPSQPAVEPKRPAVTTNAAPSKP